MAFQDGSFPRNGSRKSHTKLLWITILATNWTISGSPSLSIAFQNVCTSLPGERRAQSSALCKGKIYSFKILLYLKTKGTANRMFRKNESNVFKGATSRSKMLESSVSSCISPNLILLLWSVSLAAWPSPVFLWEVKVQWLPIGLWRFQQWMTSYQLPVDSQNNNTQTEWKLSPLSLPSSCSTSSPNHTLCLHGHQLQQPAMDENEESKIMPRQFSVISFLTDRRWLRWQRCERL